MEKDYKVRFYYFGEGPDRILTTTQLLELAGKITERTPFTDLSGAIEVVARTNLSGAERKFRGFLWLVI